MSDMPFFVTFSSETEQAHCPGNDPLVHGLCISFNNISDGISFQDLNDLAYDVQEDDPDDVEDRYCRGDVWVIAVAESKPEYMALLNALWPEGEILPPRRVSELRRLAKRAKEAL